MTFVVDCMVNVPGLGWSQYTHRFEFPDDSNVFGRVLEYRKHMEATFPGCEYKIRKAKEVIS